MECSICYDEINEGFVKLTCNHIFHLKCIGHWLLILKNNTCPYCVQIAKDHEQLYIEEPPIQPMIIIENYNNIIKFIDAIKNNNMDAVIKCIEEDNLDINSYLNNNDYPINIACYYGHVNIVKYLHEKGAILNNEGNNNNQYQYTAIFRAVFNNQIECVEYLLDNGICPNIINIYTGLSLLHYSIRMSYQVLTELLIERGADINIINRDGHSLLIDMIINENYNGVKYICEKGIDVNFQDLEGKTALIHAVKNDYGEMIHLLFKHGAKCDIVDNYNKTALLWAIYESLYTIIIDLLKEEPDINKHILSNTGILYEILNNSRHIYIKKKLIKLFCVDYKELIPATAVQEIISSFIENNMNMPYENVIEDLCDTGKISMEFINAKKLNLQFYLSLNHSPLNE